MKIVPVPVLSDNYAYLLLTDAIAKTCAAIDPAEPSKLISAANKEGWKISAILTTHHHPDHSMGNLEMANTFPNIPVYGADARIPALTIEAKEKFSLGSIAITPKLTPGHTTGSVCYYCEEEEEKAVFTGDTLFIAGCGRFFEGTPSDMWNSLKLLKDLPDATKVEYTVANLKFAKSVEPNNSRIAEKLKELESQNQVRSVPGTIEEEKEINPFLRTDEVSIIEKCEKASAYEAFKGEENIGVRILGTLRILKNES